MKREFVTRMEQSLKYGRMKKRQKILENIKGSQTKVPQRGNRENAIKH